MKTLIRVAIEDPKTVGVNFINLPRDTEVLSIVNQNENLFLYGLAPEPVGAVVTEKRGIRFLMTGMKEDLSDCRFIGTVLLNHTNKAYHAFEISSVSTMMQDALKAK